MLIKKQIAIIGGGPSALLLAAFIDTQKYTVTIYEKNKATGRKFLVAGKGGFNLTHAEPLKSFINKYTPKGFLDDAILNFSNTDFMSWLNAINIPTYIGSSKRVYPDKEIKPIAVLQAILLTLKNKGVVINYNQLFTGWDINNKALINNKSITANYTVFCLGGKSWQVTGSNGLWQDTFFKKGIETKPFMASNCGYNIKWDTHFIKSHEGEPLKNITISCRSMVQKGEATITKFGLEGNAIYGLSPEIRYSLKQWGCATISLDFKPMLSLDVVLNKLQKSKQKNITQALKKDLKLTGGQVALLKSHLSKQTFLSSNLLAKHVKGLSIKITGTATIDESISTVGGVSLNAVNNNFELKAMPNQYCIGEMLDWDAPTGGYLLQACASMGVYLAKYFNSCQ